MLIDVLWLVTESPGDRESVWGGEGKGNMCMDMGVGGRGHLEDKNLSCYSIHLYFSW